MIVDFILKWELILEDFSQGHYRIRYGEQAACMKE